MNAKKMTVIFILIVGVAIAVFDLYIIQVGGKEASISQTIILWSYEYPSVTFLLGFVCGHLFWRMRSNKGFEKIDKEGS
jgi:hypothetical protein